MNHTSMLLTILMALTTSVAQVSGEESLVEPGAKVKKLAGGMKFTEGPVWLPKEKKLVFSDIPNSKLMQCPKDPPTSALAATTSGRYLSRPAPHFTACA